MTMRTVNIIGLVGLVSLIFIVIWANFIFEIPVKAYEESLVIVDLNERESGVGAVELKPIYDYSNVPWVIKFGRVEYLMFHILIAIGFLGMIYNRPKET